MIKRMEIASSLPGAPAIQLGGFMPNDDPVQIRDIAGLGPVKAAVASAAYATGHGELFQGSSTPKRNIVLTLGLNPNWVDQSMMALRQLLYRYFMPESWGTFKFYSDELQPVTINGVVESCEPNIFSQDPEMQVSIICPKPDFIQTEATFVNDVSTAAMGTGATAIDYEGTVPTGFILRIAPGNDGATYVGNLVIMNTMGNNVDVLSLQAVTIDPAMYLELSTVKTTRYIYNVQTADGHPIDILAKMEIDSDWPEFLPGPNSFQVIHDSAALGSSNPLNWRLGYFNRYGGL